MTYTITVNPEFNSIEITFGSKPCESIRTALKDLRFRWHNLKKVWYGYTDEETARNAIETATAKPTKAPTAKTTKTATPKAEKKNKYGVEIGDIFYASWGWEQTNVDFFQVIALVGETSVRVREVCPQMIDEKPTCSMAADRTYKLTSEILPPVSRSIFIEDQENGDIKRINSIGECNPTFKLNHGNYAYKCDEDTITVYESWYA